MALTTQANTHWRSHIMLPFLVSSISLVIYLADPQASELLSYQRDLIAQGELWRLVTGHFCHLGAVHLGFNFLGMWLVFMLFPQTLNLKAGVVILLSSMLVCSAGLWFLTPQVESYVGLSAALHGLIMGAAVIDFRKHVFTNSLLLLGVLAKVLWENSPYYSDTMSTLIGGQVLVQSHLFGAVSGAVAGLVLLAWPCIYIKTKKERIIA